MTYNFTKDLMTGESPMTLEDWRLLRDDSAIRAKGIETSPIGQHLLRMADFAHKMVNLFEGTVASDSARPDITVAMWRGTEANIPRESEGVGSGVGGNAATGQVV